MKLAKLQAQIDAKKKSKSNKITIDFAGRQVYNEAEGSNERL